MEHYFQKNYEQTPYERFCNTKIGKTYLTTATIISASIIIGTSIYYLKQEKEETTQESKIEQLINKEEQNQLFK